MLPAASIPPLLAEALRRDGHMRRWRHAEILAEAAVAMPQVLAKWYLGASSPSFAGLVLLCGAALLRLAVGSHSKITIIACLAATSSGQLRSG